MAQFPCMFVIELILSTDLKDFFAVLSSLFFVKVYKRELRCWLWLNLCISYSRVTVRRLVETFLESFFLWLIGREEKLPATSSIDKKCRTIRKF